MARSGTWARWDRRVTVPLIISLGSFVLWTSWNLARDPCHPNMDLSCGFYTDHFSHMSLTRMFAERGFDIYKTPRGDLGRELTEEEFARLPEDLRTVGGHVRAVDGWSLSKPFTSSWLEIPSFYPPGDLILFAPAAAIYSFTEISFTDANRLLIQLLLLYSHVTIFLMLFLAAKEERGPPVIALVFSYAVIVHWTLEGFYDGGWIAPLLLVPFFLNRRNGVAALAAFSIAAFMHFRALFYLPWVVIAIWMIFKGEELRKIDGKKISLGAVTLITAAASSGVFFTVRPIMATHRMTSPFNPAADVFDLSSWLVLGIVVLGGLLVFAIWGAWEEVAMLLWVTLLIRLLPEVNIWDSVAFVPWILAPVRVGIANRVRLVRDARAVVAILITIVVFSESLGLGWLHAAIERVT